MLGSWFLTLVKHLLIKLYRFKQHNIMLVAVYIGPRHKPPMNSFFKPFLEDVIAFEGGVKELLLDHGKEEYTSIYPNIKLICFTGDLPARVRCLLSFATIAHIVQAAVLQFSGHSCGYPCLKCYAKANIINGKVVVANDVDATLRDIQNTYVCLKALENAPISVKHVSGVVDYSILCIFAEDEDRDFLFPQDSTTDAMHWLWNLSRYYMKLWFGDPYKVRNLSTMNVFLTVALLPE